MNYTCRGKTRVRAVSGNVEEWRKSQPLFQAFLISQDLRRRTICSVRWHQVNPLLSNWVASLIFRISVLT